MFGMSSTEFWEEEPQLYWAYRFSYEQKIEFQQKKEMEQLKFASWLQGKTNELAVSISLNNAFSKNHKDFPSYNELFNVEKNSSELKQELERRLAGITDKDERGNVEYNYWARL